MAKITKTQLDKELRDRIFEDLMDFTSGGSDYEYKKINDRQYGVILTDLNGEKRYVRIGAIVAELREDITAEELMQSEIDTYERKQDEKEIKRLKKEQKIASDKAERERKTKIIEEEKKTVNQIKGE